MTSKFDTLLAEMMPATMYDDLGTATSKITKKIAELPGKSQHWGPLQKLSPETQSQIVQSIIKHIFADNDENTYSLAIDDSDQLKVAIQDAIKEVSAKNPEFKATSKWAAKFLADRMSNKDLLGNVKYTTMSGEDAIRKDVTQKEIKQALRKALEEAPAQEPAADPASTEEEPTEDAPQEDKAVDTFYIKTADLPSDDPELQKAYSRLPDEKELTWDEVLKMIGMTKGLALLDGGGLSEITKEKETSEDEEVQALDFDDEDTADLSKFDRIIDPYFNTTKGSWSLED